MRRMKSKEEERKSNIRKLLASFCAYCELNAAQKKLSRCDRHRRIEGWGGMGKLRFWWSNIRMLNARELSTWMKRVWGADVNVNGLHPATIMVYFPKRIINKMLKHFLWNFSEMWNLFAAFKLNVFTIYRIQCSTLLKRWKCDMWQYDGMSYLPYPPVWARRESFTFSAMNQHNKK